MILILRAKLGSGLFCIFFQKKKFYKIIEDCKYERVTTLDLKKFSKYTTNNTINSGNFRDNFFVICKL